MTDSRPDQTAGPHVDVDQFFHPIELPRTRISDALDAIIRGIGNAVSWVWVILIGVIVLNVTLRYAFGQGRIEFEELQWHLYAVGFLVGLSYCIQNDSHIRIDILHERFKLKTKAWIEFFGIIVFLIPYVAVVLVYAPPFIQYSFITGEVSTAPGGLGYRWVIKSAMLIAYILILIAALSRLSRVIAYLFIKPPLIRGDKRG
ncbi:MAG: TRAP transporter small permease subunit [Rhodospirillales bacterium]|nr:MAG: TRAP transporter small permease subunit [Rhodospirillales bacterium]